MKKLILVASMALFATATFAQNNSQLPTVDVSATADTLVEPNMFYLNITINDQQGTGKVGLDNIEKTKLIPVLKEYGVDYQKELSVSSTQSAYVKKKEIAQSRSYQLILRKSDQVNPIISALAGVGVGNVSLTKVAVENSDAIRNELMVKAMREAKRDAEVLASAIGQKIGAAVKINYYGGNNIGVRPVYYMAKSVMADSNEAAVEPVDQFQKVDIRVSVNVSFMLPVSLTDMMANFADPQK